MPTFSVSIHAITVYEVTVEAASAEEAELKAENMEYSELREVDAGVEFWATEVDEHGRAV